MNLADLDDRPLPTGWIRRQSKTRKDKYYYFNTATRTSSWKHPLDMLGSHDELSVHVSFILSVITLRDLLGSQKYISIA